MSARVIGLTGQTGAGKSTVCHVLSEAGFSVIDCDALTREVQSPDSDCVHALAEAFGADILLPGGVLHRKALAAKAFADEASLKKLNETVHPFLWEALKERIKALSQGKTNGIVLDAPTLYENGVDALCGDVVAVLAPEEERLRRVVARDGITEEQARLRMSAQRDDRFYARRGGHILYNDGTPRELEERARALAANLLQKEVAG